MFNTECSGGIQLFVIIFVSSFRAEFGQLLTYSVRPSAEVVYIMAKSLGSRARLLSLCEPGNVAKPFDSVT